MISSNKSVKLRAVLLGAAAVSVLAAVGCDADEPGADTAAAAPAAASQTAPAADAASDPMAWMDPSLSADERAALAVAELTLEEKIRLLHGPMAISFGNFGADLPDDAIPAAGHIPGIPRLGIPPLRETDAGIGVTNPGGVRPGDGATALPSGLGVAATWNPAIAYDGGAMIGSEARAKGFNVLLAGPANQVREPRNGRNFEYPGEDPLLGGMIAGNQIAGIQSQGIVSTAKHFAFNAQETGRHVASANLSEADMRESELLLYEIAFEQGTPGAVMCAYNRVNSVYACENEFLLNEVLKGDWDYPGWVLSDWGAVYSTVDAANHGLDQQSGEQLDDEIYFGEPLLAAVQAGDVPEARIDEMVHRILRSMIAVGTIDTPPDRETDGEIDYDAHKSVSRGAAEQAIVLLKNDGVLPLAASAQSIALIGGRADVGVMSGGGSSTVWPIGGPAAQDQNAGGLGGLGGAIWHPSSPMDALAESVPDAALSYTGEEDVAAAAEAAANAEIAIVFVTQWMTENSDAPDLSLPNGQDALIAAVAEANPNTIVVLETGGPVLMPWLDDVAAVLEAWYPGSGGGEAIADVLTGAVNPSGRLPVTFPASLDQLPLPALPGADLPIGARNQPAPFDIDYPEGSDVGYRWYDRQGSEPLFAFGHGLSYTEFDYDGLEVSGGDVLTVSFDLANTGDRAGSEVAQLYVTVPDGTAHRLAAFDKVALAPGETQRVTLTADRRILADYDEAADVWRVAPGSYRVEVARSAAAPALAAEAELTAQSWAP